MRVFILIGVFLASGAPAWSEGWTSAGRILQSCRKVSLTGGGSSFHEGYCAGVVRGVGVNGRICPPKNSDLSQSIALVVRFIDQRPERWHEDFINLANEALENAWPCAR